MDQQHAGESLLDLEVDPLTSRSLRETTRWTKFIAIVYAVILGILLVVGIIGGASFADGVVSALENYEFPFASIVGNALLLILFVAVAIGGVLLFFLFKFSAQTKAGLDRQEQIQFNGGLKSLRNYFIIYGVIVILNFFLVLAVTAMAFFTLNA